MSQGAPLQRAKAPVGPGRISLIGVVLAILTIALGMVGVRDALISSDVLQGTSWIEGAVDRFDGLEAQWWAVPVGALMVLLGLWLLLASVRPRPAREVALRAETGVFLRPRDVKKIAERAAEDVDGVLSADVAASRKSVKVKATVTADDGRIAADVQSAVSDALSALENTPRIKVATDSKGLS